MDNVNVARTHNVYPAYSPKEARTHNAYPAYSPEEAISANETSGELGSTACKEGLLTRIYMLFASLCIYSVDKVATACRNLTNSTAEIGSDFRFLSFLSSEEATALTNIATALEDKTAQIVNHGPSDQGVSIYK